MAFPFMLVAAQAAGIGSNLWSTRQKARSENRAIDTQIGFMNQAFGVAENELGAEMDQIALSSSEQSLMNSQRLLETMASNRALAGARGQLMAGSALGVQNNAVKSFNADERAREISNTLNKFKLDSQSRTMKINQISNIGKLKGLKSMAKSQRHANLSKMSMDMQGFNQIFGSVGNSFSG